jgi:hypothetical protein
VGPAIFHDYMTMLRRQELMTPWGFIPWFMPNVRGFLQWWLARWLDAGLILPVVFMSSAVVGVVAAWFVLRKGALGDKTVRGKANGDESMVYSLAILTTLLVSYHLHMQDLTLALLPMLVLVDRSICEWQEGGAGRGVEAKIGGAQPLAIKNSTIQNSTVWTAASAAAIAGFYLYRIAAELFPILLMRYPYSCSGWSLCDGGARADSFLNLLLYAPRSNSHCVYALVGIDCRLRSYYCHPYGCV